MKVQLVDYQASDAAGNLTTSLHETGFAILTTIPSRRRALTNHIRLGGIFCWQ